MEKPVNTDFFTKELAQGYDERNSRLHPISDNMHFLIRLLLSNLSSNARILCVGVGTGAEILSLATEFPNWSFVGVDPSQSMLDVCRERLTKAKVIDRCNLIHGYVENVHIDEKFDAVVSILVSHFVKREDRLTYFKHMVDRLKSQGYLVNTEISYDLNSDEFPMMLKNWEQVQRLMGGTSESLAKLPDQLRNILSVVSNQETEEYLRSSGISTPVRFFQSFMIHGWYGKKA